MAKIHTVVIPTRNRVESLERALVSYVMSGKIFGRELEFVVADNSESADYRQHTRGLLRSIARSYDVRVRYAGLEEKRTFAEALAGVTTLPQSLIDFALFGTQAAGPRAGANRNALLLDSIDDTFFSADDDTVCRAFSIAECDDAALEVHTPMKKVWDGHGQPADFVWRILPDLDAAVRVAKAVPIDIIASHERLLGEPVADIESSFRPNPHRHGHRESIRSDSRSTPRVMFTMAGVLGDLGVDERWHLVGTTAEARALQHPESAYRLGLTSRILFRCARRTTITRWVGLHGMFFGADHRQLIPPFFPQFRGQDTLMGWMVRKCHPQAQFGFLPHAQLHVPKPRAFSRGFEHLLCNVSMSSVLVSLISPARDSNTPESALHAISQELCAASKRPLEEFLDALREAWRTPVEPWLLSFVESLRSPESRHLRQALEQIVETRRLSAEQHDGLPLDVVEGRGRAAAQVLTQELVRRFGELLEAWPSIVSGTRRLRAQGLRLAAMLG